MYSISLLIVRIHDVVAKSLFKLSVQITQEILIIFHPHCSNISRANSRDSLSMHIANCRYECFNKTARSHHVIVRYAGGSC